MVLVNGSKKQSSNRIPFAVLFKQVLHDCRQSLDPFRLPGASAMAIASNDSFVKRHYRERKEREGSACILAVKV